jgi:hypothetical protein
MSATMEPRLVTPSYVRPKKQKARRVRNFGIPGLGRIAFSRDPGEASLFAERFLRTRLGARVFNPYGELVEEYDLGSGKVTNLGVLALANDMNWAQVSGSPVNTLAVSKFHAWGTGVTAAAVTDFELGAYAAPTAATENAVEGTNSLVFQNEGKNQTILSTAKIKAGGTLSITEWGLHTAKAIKPANKTATATSGVSLSETTGKPFTESTATVRGEQNTVVWAEKTEAVIGMITKSSKEVLTIPGWVKAGHEEKGTTPEATTKFRVIPLLFDHRVFTSIGVESGNEIEFPWSLELVAGG